MSNIPRGHGAGFGGQVQPLAVLVVDVDRQVGLEPRPVAAVRRAAVQGDVCVRSVRDVVRRQGVDGVPADHVDGLFPAAALRAEAPVAARYAVVVARALRGALQDRSLSGLCRQAGLARTTVQDLLAGRTWPDLATLAKLEDALDTTLWPSREELPDR